MKGQKRNNCNSIINKYIKNKETGFKYIPYIAKKEKRKENSIKIQREPTVWENIFANGTSEKVLITKMYKELT